MTAKRVVLASLVTLCFSGPVVAQSEEELVGVWTVTKSEAVRPDGTKSATFGTNPYSQLILTANGRFSQIFIRSDIPKFAANSRQHGTPEENAAAVKGSNAEFGSWSLAGKDVTLKIEASNFPNWTGVTQQRTITSVTPATMTWTLTITASGLHVVTDWKRVK